MPSRHPVADIRILLADGLWLRRLARRLAVCESDADDAIQDTWLAALRAPPEADRPARPWLMSVLRHALRRRNRTDCRRRSREHQVAAGGPDSAEYAEEALERLELHRLIAELVSSLEEPYRSTIVWRFFDGRSGAQIAREAAVPEGTVRWRIKEGLCRLRARLDERWSGFHSWRSVVLATPSGPLLDGAITSQANHLWKGALMMKSGAKTGAVAVLGALALVTGISLFVARGEAPDLTANGLAGIAPPAHRSEQRRQPRAEAVAPHVPNWQDGSPPPRFVSPSGGGSPEASSATEPVVPPPSRPSAAIPLGRRHDFTQGELEALARNCEVRSELPGMRTVNDVPMAWLEEKDLAALPLRPGELPLIREAIRTYRDALNDSVRRWYVEVTRHTEGARSLEFLHLSDPDHPNLQRITAHLTMRQISEGARRVAEELAGWTKPSDPAPSDPVIAGAADLYRKQSALADAFERDLTSVMGPARAGEIRRSAVVGHTRRAGCF